MCSFQNPSKHEALNSRSASELQARSCRRCLCLELGAFVSWAQASESWGVQGVFCSRHTKNYQPECALPFRFDRAPWKGSKQSQFAMPRSRQHTTKRIRGLSKSDVVENNLVGDTLLGILPYLPSCFFFCSGHPSKAYPGVFPMIA